MTDRPTEGQTNEALGKYGMPPITFAWSKKMNYGFFFMKASRTYGPIDGPTYGRTDRPGYRDARTHLKTEGWTAMGRIVEMQGTI